MPAWRANFDHSIATILSDFPSSWIGSYEYGFQPCNQYLVLKASLTDLVNLILANGCPCDRG
jgi:hypothetical protein